MRKIHDNGLETDFIYKHYLYGANNYSILPVFFLALLLA